jgi:hypothetical protein
MNVLTAAKTAMLTLNDTLSTIARKNGQTVKAVTVDVEKTNLDAGKIVGTVTVNNRSRRPFTVNVTGSGVVVKFYGEEAKIAA